MAWLLYQYQDHFVLPAIIILDTIWRECIFNQIITSFSSDKTGPYFQMINGTLKYVKLLSNFGVKNSPSSLTLSEVEFK